MRVVEPLNVEMPRSMVAVVTSWNIPMSRWLKTCESKLSQNRGASGALTNTFLSVDWSTNYSVRSCVHGIQCRSGMGSGILHMWSICIVHHLFMSYYCKFFFSKKM